MNTRYGDLPDELLIAWVDELIPSLFKMLPMKEEESSTLSIYNEKLISRLLGAESLVNELKSNADFAELIVILECLSIQDDFSYYRSDVFEAIGIVNKIKSSLIGGEDK